MSTTSNAEFATSCCFYQVFGLQDVNYWPAINKETSPGAGDRRGRGFEHRVENPEVVEKFFSKVLKISEFFRFSGHCILKNAVLSTGCYSIMGQRFFCEIAEFWFELFDH